MPSSSTLLLARAYIDSHPDCRESMNRAIFAYHRNHGEPNAHYFAGSWREAPCRWCGRTREEVRWDDLPPKCALRPKYADNPIENVITREEALFEKVLSRAKTLAASIDLTALTGESLATFHHTHGVDPSMLECALMELGKGSLSQGLHDEYQIAYALHRDTGKHGQKKVVVIAK